MFERVTRALAVFALFVLVGAQAAMACTLPVLQTGERPDANGGPTQVTASFIVADLLGVDDVNQQLDLDLIGNFSWTDPRLTGLEGCRFNVSQVWFPPLLLYNSSNLREKRTQARNQVLVGANGKVSYAQRYTGQISSYHNLRDFPFDTQKFLIEIGPISLNSDQLQLIADNENTWISKRLNIEGWAVEGVNLVSEEYFLKQMDQDVSVLALTIDAKRDQDYYVYRVLLLLGFVVAMSWIIFWIPPSRFEFQIGLGATAMLTVIAFNLSVSSSLPRLGYLTIMDKILAVSIGLVFLTIVEALVTGLLVLKKQEELAVKIDKVSRFLFPAALIISWYMLIAG